MTICCACCDQLEPKKKDWKDKSGSMKRCKHLSDINSEVDDDIERFHGDGLVVRMHSNHRVLEITGDSCRIVLARNSGSVRVIGDCCRLHINHNEGNIEYTGDGGRVLLGSGSVKGKVRFVGDGGKVIFDSSPETESKIERNISGKCTKKRMNKEGSYLVKNIHYSCKEVIDKTLRCERCGVDDGTLNQELDNAANDTKGKNQEKYVKRNGEARKSSRYQTVTKIITKSKPRMNA